MGSEEGAIGSEEGSSNWRRDWVISGEERASDQGRGGHMMDRSISGGEGRAISSGWATGSWERASNWQWAQGRGKAEQSRAEGNLTHLCSQN